MKWGWMETIESPQERKRKVVWKVGWNYHFDFWFEMIDFWFIDFLLCLPYFCKSYLFPPVLDTGGHAFWASWRRHGSWAWWGEKSLKIHSAATQTTDLMPAECSDTGNVAHFNKRGALEQLLWEAVDATVKGQPSCMSVASPKYEDGKTRLLLTSDVIHYLMYSLHDASSTRLSQWKQEGPKERSQACEASAWLSAFTSHVDLNQLKDLHPLKNRGQWITHLGGIKQWTWMVFWGICPQNSMCCLGW